MPGYARTQGTCGHKPQSFKIMTPPPHQVLIITCYNCGDINAFRTVTTPSLGAPRRLGLGNVASFFGDADESGALDVFS